MGEGVVLSKQERINEALETLRETEYVEQNRGDGFDIGGINETEQSTDLVTLLSNPQELVNQLGLTRKQAINVKSVVAGAGASAGYKLLSQYIGGELASAVGGFLGAYISRRIIGGK